jgi:hypothetical protein
MTTRSDPLCRREFLARATQATVAVAASAATGAAFSPLLARAGEASSSRASRISYYCNGEIHVNEIGQPEGQPVTTGHWDFKPSWSKTGDLLVCFRRLKDDPDVLQWKTAILVVHVDGTGFHQLSDGTHTDFNPTFPGSLGNKPARHASRLEPNINCLACRPGSPSFPTGGIVRRIDDPFADNRSAWIYRATLPTGNKEKR